MNMTQLLTPRPAKLSVSHSTVTGIGNYDLRDLYSPDNAMWQAKCLELVSPKYRPPAGYIWDASRYQNHGTITGAIWRQLDTGIWVLKFDGVDDYVEVPDSVSLNSATGAGQTRTVTFWFKTTQAGNKVVLEKGTNLHFAVQVGFPTDGKISWRVETITTNIIESSTTVNNDVWHYFAGTYDGTVAELFIDGVSQGTNSSQVGPADTTDTVAIGSRLGTAAFNGELAGVSIFNRTLITREVQMRYNQERYLYGV